MKRYFSLILCLLFVMISSMTNDNFFYGLKRAFAQTGETGMADEGPKTVSIPAQVVVEPCKGLTIPIDIDEAAGIAGMDLDLRFDPEILILVDVKRTVLTNDFLLMFRDAGDGLLSVSMAYHSGITSGSGAFINLIFDVSPDAILPGSTGITIEKARLYNENADTMEDIVNGNGQILMQGIGINLPSGWSMISLPAIPVNAKASVLFPDAVVIYKYERDKGYIRVPGGESLEIGQGYWIMVNNEYNYPVTGRPIQSYNISLYENGWGMFGGCACPARAQLHNGKIMVIYHYVQGAGYQRVPANGHLEAGKGYWILCRDIIGDAKLEVKRVPYFDAHRASY